MNELQCYSLSASSSKGVTLASSCNQLFSNLRQSTESQDSSTIYHPKFSLLEAAESREQIEVFTAQKI
jgi:hypothetical protein